MEPIGRNFKLSAKLFNLLLAHLQAQAYGTVFSIGFLAHQMLCIQAGANLALVRLQGQIIALRMLGKQLFDDLFELCLLYTSPSPRDGLLSRMPSSA